MNRVLLADDNEVLRSALALLLETRLGVRVVAEASCMEEVLAEVAAVQPEAVVLDWELPGQPETGRVAALRRAAPGVKIIVASARPESGALACADEADAFINKSDPPEALLRIFQSC
jgi:two-component system response regulator DesR